MSERFMYFDSNALILDGDGKMIPDRTYNAQEWTDFIAALTTSGIMKGSGKMLKVDTSGSNMVTTLDTGIAFLEGRYYHNDSLLTHTHDTESLGRNRIDRIVIRMDTRTEARWVKSFIKKGVASVAPIAPTLHRDSEVYEISVAQVKVIGGQTFINQVDIVDERENADVCGWAGSNILPSFDDNALAAHINKNASATELGHVKLNNALTSTSTTEAATANAVKMVNDKIMGNGWVPITSFGYLWNVDATKGDYLQVRKASNGIVQVRGVIRCSGSGHGSVPFNLPSGYMPKNHLSSAVVHDVVANDFPLGTSSTMNLNSLNNGSVSLTYPVPAMSGRKIWLDFTFVSSEI